jgi:hypothetical protein
LQLVNVNLTRYSDAEYFYARSLCLVCIWYCLFSIAVGSTIGDENSNLWNIWSCAMLWAKHHRASNVQGGSNIRFTSVNVQRADAVRKISSIVVRVQENWSRNPVTEDDDANLGQIRRDRE